MVFVTMLQILEDDALELKMRMLQSASVIALLWQGLVHFILTFMAWGLKFPWCFPYLKQKNKI